MSFTGCVVKDHPIIDGQVHTTHPLHKLDKPMVGYVVGARTLREGYTEHILTDVQPLLDFVPTSPVLPSISHSLFSASLRHPAGTLFTMVDSTGYVKKIDWSIEMYDGTDPSRVIVSSSQGVVSAASEFSHSRASISTFEDNQQGMRDVLDLIILRTSH